VASPRPAQAMLPSTNEEVIKSVCNFMMCPF
jgi:hypothetical protein